MLRYNGRKRGHGMVIKTPITGGQDVKAQRKVLVKEKIWYEQHIMFHLWRKISLEERMSKNKWNSSEHIATKPMRLVVLTVSNQDTLIEWIMHYPIKKSSLIPRSTMGINTIKIERFLKKSNK